MPGGQAGGQLGQVWVNLNVGVFGGIDGMNGHTYSCVCVSVHLAVCNYAMNALSYL